MGQQPYNKIYDEEKWARVNQENKDIMEDYLMELKAQKKKDTTIYQYKNDLRIVCIYVLDNCENKAFTDLGRKDFRRLVLWLTDTCGVSNARANRLMSAVRTLLSYLEDDDDNDYEITVDMLEQMNDLRVTDGKIDDIINSEKGSRVAGEALYFLGVDWINRNFKYEQDHLHPYDRFDSTKPISVSMDDWRKWRSNRNRLPNLQLLEGRSNGSKNAMRLVDYYNDMNDEQKADFCKEALIPEGVSLELENFEEFYEKRKALLTAKIRQLLG